MRGMIRLIQGLQEGDPTATYVLVFAVIGTAAIVLAAGLVRTRRKRQSRPES